MSIYRIEANRLRIADEVRDKFIVAYDEFGSGIAYSSDTLVVFHDETGTKIFDISRDTFKWLTGEFFILEGFLYHSLDKLGRINSGAILGCTKLYVWDQKTVYYLNGPVDGANPATFQDLGNYWALDDNNCFFQQRQIKEADAATFRVIDESFAVDKNFIYAFLGRVVAEYENDPIPLGRGYYKISNRVFFGHTEMPDAAPQSFKVLPLITPEEKQKIWAAGGPKHEEEAMAVSGFTAFDARHKYKGTWYAKPKK